MDLVRFLGAFLCVLSFVDCVAAESLRGDWPQFRGPQGQATGVAGEYPVRFGPDENVAWVTELPSGISSPCVVGDRIFLTGYNPEAKQLETLCIDRTSGDILWQRIAPTDEIESVHQTSNPANATPAADAQHVYVYFGSYGLLCYDHDGNEAWKVPLPIPQTRQGTGTSPIVVGDLVLLHRDERLSPFLLAVDKASGETVWKHEYSFPASMQSESYSTPSIHDNEVIVHAHGEILALSLADGTLRWKLRVPTNGCSSPSIVDGIAYIAAWTNGGESALHSPLPDFASLVEKSDANKDGLIQRDEFPDELAFSLRPEAADVDDAQVYLKKFFGFLDGNKDKQLDENEWTGVVNMQKGAYAREHGLLAIDLGEVENPAARVKWAERKAIPEVPSPVYANGRVYMVKNGGIVSCLEAATGKSLYRRRIGGPGIYYASPVVINGKIYATSGTGIVTVFEEGDKPTVVAQNDLGEPVSATPAAVGGTLYFRTSKHLYAFRLMDSP